MKLFKKIGGVLKKGAGLLGMVPGVGTVGGGILGGLGGLMEGGGLRGMAQGAAGGASGGLLGGLNFGGGGNILSRIGGAVKDAYSVGGKPDLQRMIGTGGAIADIMGRRKQRKSTERYSNAMIDERNKLMSQILSQPQYDFNPTD